MPKKLTVVFTVADDCPKESLELLMHDQLPGLRSNFLSWSDLSQTRAVLDARCLELEQQLAAVPGTPMAWSVRPVGSKSAGSLYITLPAGVTDDPSLEVVPLYAGPGLPAEVPEMVTCPACEGHPSGENVPCGVCGEGANLSPTAVPCTVRMPAELAEMLLDWARHYETGRHSAAEHPRTESATH